MTQHELLSFVDFLRREMQKEGWPADVWPTREVVLDNLTFNRDRWGPHWGNEYRDTRRTLLRKQWLLEEACSPSCHAVHVRLTAAGIEALRLMDADPDACRRTHIHVKRRDRCHANFRYQKRKAA